MRIVHTIAQLRQALAGSRGPAFVPTMGHLHAGHLSLISRARGRGDLLVVSIFVNRLQFANDADYEAYPRTWDADCARLRAARCDLLFAPAEGEIHGDLQGFKVQPPAALADMLEGAAHPGLFAGVCTVVLKLLGCVQPRIAMFGKKDYQQLLILRRMARELMLPSEIVSGETLRGADGVALASRNARLSAVERVEAAQLPWLLARMASQVNAGEPVPRVEAMAMNLLTRRGWVPDYLTVRRRSDLQAPDGRSPLVVLGAARLGSTRLIDSIEV